MAAERLPTCSASRLSLAADLNELGDDLVDSLQGGVERELVGVCMRGIPARVSKCDVRLFGV